MRSHGQVRANSLGMKLIGALGVVVAAALLWGVAVAGAVEHPLKETFGSAAQPAFPYATGMTTDPATGDLLVIDQENQTVNRFKPNGEADNFSALTSNKIDGHPGEADAVPVIGAILASELGDYSEVQIAVAPPGAPGGTQGDIYVTDPEHHVLDVFASTGAFIASKEVKNYPCGVAVDPAGNLYIANREGPDGEGVHKYTPTAPGAFTESAAGTYPSAFTCQLAASPDFVYATEEHSVIHKIHSNGAQEGTTTFTISVGSGPIALNPNSGHLFVTLPFESSHPLNEYDVSGASEATLVSSTLLAGEPQGVTVDAANNLYVNRDANEKVEVFGPIPAPAVSAVKPPEGPTAGGTEIEITGTNLGSALKVEIGGAEAKIKSNPSTTKIKVTSPAHAPGTVDVIVTTAGGASPTVLADHFTYVLPSQALTISKAGNGSGSVSCNGGACAASYPQGTKVTLSASADSGSSFGGWSGGGCSGSGGCTVVLEGPSAVTATFNKVETCANTPALCGPPPPPKCIVPKLAKKSLSQAKSALKAAHCALGKVTKPKPKKGKKTGPLVVKSSSPGAGKELAENAKVNLKLGPKPKPKKKAGK